MEKRQKEMMIDRLVQNDVTDITQALNNGDCEFLHRVLTGEGWKPYNQLTDEEVISEYKDREFDK